MKKFGHVYDVTEFYNTIHRPDFAKYFVSEDVFDYHIYRIIVGFNSMYDAEPDTKLIEQSDIPKRRIIDYLNSKGWGIKCKDCRNFPDNVDALVTFNPLEDYEKEVLKAVIACDTYDNDDLREYRFNAPMEELLDDIDGGYGTTILDINLDVK